MAIGHIAAYGPAKDGPADARVTPYDASGGKPPSMTPPAAQAAAAPGGANLYVKGVPKSLTQQNLDSLFRAQGFTITRSQLREMAGSDTNCSMVQLATPEEAASAIAKLNGQVGLPGIDTPLSIDYAFVKKAEHAPVQTHHAHPQGGQTSQWGGAAAATQRIDQPSANLYITQLPADMDQTRLNAIFVGAGYSVSRSRVMAPFGGQGSSAAMVEVASSEEAADAMQKLSGKTPEGCTEAIKIEYANQGKGKGKGKEDQDMGKGKGKEAQKQDNLFIQPVPCDMDSGTLAAAFEKAGFIVIRSKVLPSGAREDTAAMVQLANEEQAAQAIQKLNGQTPEGFSVPISVAFASQRKEKGDAKGKGKGFAPVTKATGQMTLNVVYQGAARTPSDNLYIMGLPSPQIDMPTLKLLFSSLGVELVRAKVIADDRGKGHSAAMCQVESQEVAAKVIEELNGQTMSCEELRALAGDDMDVDGPAMVVKYAGTEETPSDNLFVSGLPSPTVKQNVLKEVFGLIGCEVIRTKLMPDSRGCGHSQALVQCASQEMAALAISMLNGEVFPQEEEGAGGTTLTVKYQGFGGEASDNLYITGLPSPQVNQQGFKSIFAQLGLTVVRMKCIPDDRGRGTSSAMVQLASQAEAANAIEQLNDQPIEGLTAEQPSQGHGGPNAPGTLTVKFAGTGEPSDNLYISGLPGTQSETNVLNNLFATLELGPVVRCRVIADTKGTGTHVAMVQLPNQQQAEAAIQALNGQVLSLADLNAMQSAAPAQAAQPMQQQHQQQQQQQQPGQGMVQSRMQAMIASRGKGAGKGQAPQAFCRTCDFCKTQMASTCTECPGCGKPFQAAQQSAPAAGAGPMQVRFAGKKDAAGNTLPSDYVTMAGFPGALPSEAVMKLTLATIPGIEMKRMRVMNGQVMVQAGSVEQANKIIQQLNGWPWAEAEEPWPED